MTKRITVGTMKLDGREVSIVCEIEYTNGGLSIMGTVGRDWAGQIDGGFAHRNPADNDSRTSNPITPEQIKFAHGWNAELWYQFLDTWERWHLNDMRAGCEHQRALGWDKERIDPSKGAEAYGLHHEGQKYPSWNLRGWVYPPHGYLMKPYPICGYKYGSAWKVEPVPEHVIVWLFALPEGV